MMPEKLVKFGFFLLYNHLAFTYDAVAWLVSFGQWANWRRTALQYLQPGPVLELAFGTGGLYADMISEGFAPVGIDLSPYMVRLTDKRLRRQQQQGAILRTRTQTLPFPNDHFVNVVATFPSNYIFDETTLQEIHRVLSSDPRLCPTLVIVMQGEMRSYGLWKHLIDGLYYLTRQQETLMPDLLPRLKEAGFIARRELATYASAEAHIILAQKQFD